MNGVALRSLAGLALGIVFAVLQLILFDAIQRSFHDLTALPPLVDLGYASFEIANKPAWGICYVWTCVLRLPPYNEYGAWVILPGVAVLIQWGLIGFACGLWLGYRSRRRKQGRETGSIKPSS